MAENETHIHIHLDGLDTIFNYRFDRLEEKMDSINHKAELLIMISNETRAVVDRVNAATTKIGTEVTEVAVTLNELKSQITTSMTPEEVASVNAELGGSADKLEAAGATLDTMGSNPDNPVPTEPPVA